VPSARLHFISSEFKVDSIIGLTRRSNANGGYVLLTMRASTEINTHNTCALLDHTENKNIFFFNGGSVVVVVVQDKRCYPSLIVPGLL
jgi:hypothetical protein